MTGEDCSQPPEGVRRDHVAVAVDDVEMHRVAADRAGAGGEHVALATGKLSGAVPRQRRIVLVVMGPDAADGRLAGAAGADRGAPSLGGAGVDRLAVAGDRARPQLERGAVADELAPLGVVGVGEQRLDRHVDEFRVAVEGVAIGKGELRRLDLEVDEIRPGRIEAVEVEALEERELLQGRQPLLPGTAFQHRVAAVIVADRRLDRRLPARHVVGGEHAAMRAARGVHHLLRAAEAVDRLGDEALRPGLARALDLRSRSPPALSASLRMRS